MKRLSLLLILSMASLLAYTCSAQNTNTATGNQACSHLTSGTDNTCDGYEAGFHTTIGSDNTFVGGENGVLNTTGYNNTFLGYQAGFLSTTGYGNIFLGAFAGYNTTTGNSNIFIGNIGPIGESHTIRIGTQGSGDGEQSWTNIAGIWDVSSPAGVPVYINSAGRLGTNTSSLRYKERIQDMGDSTNALMKLRPVTFYYKPDYAEGERTMQYGLIAEEVAKVYPDLVVYDDQGRPDTVRYQYITTMLLNEVQKQYHRAEAQAKQIQADQQVIETLKQQVQLQNATLQERLSRLEAQVRVQVAAVTK